jgi:hypothetical protein
VTASFCFYTQAQPFEKSERGQVSMRIGGIVSTPNRDQEGERLLKDGLDFGPFLKQGYFNDNHGKETIHVVGYPTADVRWVHKGETLPNGQAAKVAGWWVEGALVGERGREIFKIAKDLKDQKAPRQLGFSVQGATLERNPLDQRDVTKAVVKQIAITFCPVNAETELVVLSKALAAGSAIANPGAAPGGGFALRREALDGQTKISGSKDDLLVLRARPRKRKKKGLAPQEGHALLRSLYPNLPESTIGAAYRFACSLKHAMGEVC